MTSKQTKVRVGLFAAAAVTLVVIVIVTFTSLHLFRHRDHFTVLFSGSVYGLEQGSLVYFDGIKSGNVDNIEIAPDDLTKVRVSIVIDPSTPMRADTTAEMTMAGITGLKIVDLRGGTPSSPRLADGATIVAKVGVLDKLQANAESIAAKTDQLMDKIGKLVDRSTSVAGNIDDASGALRDLITENKEALHHAIATVDATIASTGKQLDKLADSANQAVTGVHALVDGANGLVGDVGRIVHNNETQLTGMMADLRQASRTFKDLARELREKPSRLLFSATGSDRKLP